MIKLIEESLKRIEDSKNEIKENIIILLKETLLNSDLLNNEIKNELYKDLDDSDFIKQKILRNVSVSHDYNKISLDPDRDLVYINDTVFSYNENLIKELENGDFICASDTFNHEKRNDSYFGYMIDESILLVKNGLCLILYRNEDYYDCKEEEEFNIVLLDNFTIDEEIIVFR